MEKLRIVVVFYFILIIVYTLTGITNPDFIFQYSRYYGYLISNEYANMYNNSYTDLVVIGHSLLLLIIIAVISMLINNYPRAVQIFGMLLVFFLVFIVAGFVQQWKERHIFHKSFIVYLTGNLISIFGLTFIIAVWYLAFLKKKITDTGNSDSYVNMIRKELFPGAPVEERKWHPYLKWTTVIYFVILYLKALAAIAYMVVAPSKFAFIGNPAVTLVHPVIITLFAILLTFKGRWPVVLFSLFLSYTFIASGFLVYVLVQLDDYFYLGRKYTLFMLSSSVIVMLVSVVMVGLYFRKRYVDQES